MRKKVLVLIIAFILFVPYINVSASSSANTIAELRKEIAALKAKKKAQNSVKSQTQSQINATTNSLNKTKDEITEGRKQIEEAKIHTADSIEAALKDGVDHAMNAFNPRRKG